MTDSTKLLVSVRNAEEARLALAEGVDLIDIKEPSRGALGPADPSVWAEIREAVAGQTPLSVALGELLDERIFEYAAEAHSVRFAKIGLAGCAATTGWLARLGRVVRALPGQVQPVPVAYADWPAAGAPSPSVVVAIAARCSARLMLIDTHDKSRDGLLQHLSLDALMEIAEHAHAQDVQLALAGSLDAGAIELLLPLRPAYVGVRGAVCSGGRGGAVVPALVKSLAELIHRSARKVAQRCLT